MGAPTALGYRERQPAPQWLTVLCHPLTDPRRTMPCRTCDGAGMLETWGGVEGECPECEGGVWAERETWRQFFTALRLPFGYRVSASSWRLYKDWPV